MTDTQIRVIEKTIENMRYMAGMSTTPDHIKHFLSVEIARLGSLLK